MGWEAPPLPKHPVFSFMAAWLQPQNRQIMNDLECCKNIHIINVYLGREIHIFRERAFTMASSFVEDLGNSYPWPRERFAYLDPEVGEGTEQ